MKKHTIRAIPVDDTSSQVVRPVESKLSTLDLAVGTSVALPSNFVFYKFKDLYIKPFKTLHLAKLIKAQQEQSPSHLAEVVDSVLSTSSGETGLAFKLTHPDYMWVLYWLRLNSFSKFEYIVKGTCNNPKHIEQVKSGKLDKKTLKISSKVTKSVLDCTMLPEDFKVDISEYLPQDIELPPGFTLSVPVYQDIIDMADDPNMLYQGKGGKTEEQEYNAAYMYQATPALLMKWPGATWKQRFDFAGELSPDDYMRVGEYANSIPDYGIKETVELTCGVCGAKRKVLSYVDARSFFHTA